MRIENYEDYLSTKSTDVGDIVISSTFPILISGLQSCSSASWIIKVPEPINPKLTAVRPHGGKLIHHFSTVSFISLMKCRKPLPCSVIPVDTFSILFVKLYSFQNLSVSFHTSLMQPFSNSILPESAILSIEVSNEPN